VDVLSTGTIYYDKETLFCDDVETKTHGHGMVNNSKTRPKLYTVYTSTYRRYADAKASYRIVTELLIIGTAIRSAYR
jgi:hypothetical protein